jgi:hypothetical protein
MKMLWILVGSAWMMACGSSGGTGGTSSGGSPSQGGEAGSGGDVANGGASEGGAPAGGSGGGPVGGGEAGGSGGAGGGGVEACANPLRCIDGSNYYCDEISGPDDGSFEAACTEAFGTVSQGSCTDADFNWVDACVFDCVTPNEFSNIGDLDPDACYVAGGIYVTNAL